MTTPRHDLPVSYQRRAAGHLRRFRDSDRGTSTIEFVLWFPFYFVLLGLIGDTTLAFMNYSRMWDVARDTARRATVGEMSAAVARQYAIDSLPDFIAPTVVVDETHPVDIVVSIQAPITNLVYFNAFEAFGIGDVTANVVMRKEL